MNKKDVLGSRPAAWNASKMKSVPHGGKAAFVQKAVFALIE
jgi:hypothetical protein